MADSFSASFLQALPMAAILIGVNERILASNDRAGALLGPKLVGRHFITGLRQPSVLDAIEATLRDSQPRVCRYLANDGTQERAYDVSCVLLSTDLGDAILLCFEDTTHLERAGQMRRDFIANVSHELRTPLTALSGFIETLQGPARDDPAAQARFLAIMADEARRMERLVQDLMSLSQVESVERQRPDDPVDMGALIASVLHSVAPLAEASNATLEYVPPKTAIIVPGDADQLRQVVTNLVENALKYGGAKGKVTITIEMSDMETTLRGPGVVLCVADAGPGIAARHLPRLTERFYRVDGHRARTVGGTGLGLAIVKHIVSRHRGRLRIDSREGQGSRFTVVLPKG